MTTNPHAEFSPRHEVNPVFHLQRTENYYYLPITHLVAQRMLPVLQWGSFLRVLEP
jgi:hypothetical protein